MIFYDQKYKRKKYFRAFAVALAVVVMGLIVSLTLNILFALRQEVKATNSFDIVESYRYYYTPIHDKKIALTFDDGPHPVYTPMIARILKKHDVPAAFFFMGEKVFKYPDVVEAVASDGFEIGNHTFTHAESVHSSTKRLEDELRSTGKIIEISAGKAPLFYRSPYLLDIGPDPTINPEVPPVEPLLVAYQNGYIPVGADLDPKDWMLSSDGELFENFMREASRGGHIALLHDGGLDDTKHTVAVLEDIIIELKARGYEFVSLRELLVPPASIRIENRLASGSTDSATGGEVSLLQWFLYTQNFLEYESITGRFDAATQSALQAWQIKKGLVDVSNVGRTGEYGVTGDMTRQAILVASWSQDGGALSPVQAASSNTLIDRLERYDLKLISWAVYFSVYAFAALIILIVSRILLIAGLFIFSLFKKLRKRSKKSPEYHGGVSILIAAYNEEENIESTLRSILNDKYPQKEVIVINDGSTDNTLQVIQNVQLEYPGKIELVNVENGGKAKALNIGVKAAKYKIFIAMDADTVFAPGTISQLVRHFGDPEVGAVAGKVETTKSRGLLDIFQSIEYEVGQNIEKRIFASVNAVGVVPGPVGAWRRSAVLKAGGYSDETLVEDQDLTLAILTSGYKIIYEPKAVCYTETPHTLKDFLKQRFRWIYGTFQCVWKYKGHVLKKPLSPFSLVILPNTVLFSIITPLFYPLVDAVLLFALLLGSWQQVLTTYLLFTGVDMLYASLAFTGNKENLKRLLFIPIQRLYYRQVIYYVVARSMLKAIEGNQETWGKVAKLGESHRYYLSRFGLENIKN